MYEEKKIFLQRYSDLTKEVERLTEELNRWKDLATQITLFYSGMPHGANQVDKIQGTVEKILDTEELLQGKIEQLLKTKREIEQSIDELEDIKLRYLMKYRYINGNTLERIAEKMGYSYQWIYKLYKEALEKIEIEGIR